MTSDRISRNFTYVPDNFTQNISQEDLIHRFSNNTSINIASTRWMWYHPGEMFSTRTDPKIDKRDIKVNAYATCVNNKNKYIKRYCF